MRRILAVAVVLSLALAARAEDGAGTKGKTKGDHTAGIVVDVKKDKDKDEGTLTIKVHKHKKKGAAAVPAEEKTFKVTSTTTFEKVSGKKGDKQVTSVTFAAVQKGEHVRLTIKDGALVDVKIHSKKKGKTDAN
jgi:hypothetical protein